MGLGLGDWKLASLLAAVYMPLVVIGTWFLSSDPAFQAQYPHYQPAAYKWHFFIVYELLFLFYWFGWEYLWRGFMLFGTVHKLGYYAIFVQAVPFAALHVDKPFAEAMLFGGGRNCAGGAGMAVPVILDCRADPRSANAHPGPVVHASDPHRRFRGGL